MPSTISLRIPVRVWMHHIDELFEFLEPYFSTIEEVSLFTSETHPPLPLNVIQERAVVAKGVIARFRARGIRAGINHLSTIGHLPENLENSLNEPWQRMISSDGLLTEGVFCATDPNVVNYIKESYIALSNAEPDFIWIDDDVRLEGRISPGQLCFCDACMAQFSEGSGRTWTRETLIAVFDSEDIAESLPVRRAWLAHNRAYVSRVLGIIRETVDSIDPSIVLGFMVTELAYSGYGAEQWADVLRGGDRKVMWRPGGGFYQDATPGDLIHKLLSVGRQNSQAPDYVTDIQYEHENFPYYRLAKSTTIFKGEIAGAIGAGCSGVALNCLPGFGDPFDEYRDWFECVVGAEKLFDKAADTFGRSPNEGLCDVHTVDNLAVCRAGSGWLNGGVWSGEHVAMQDLAQLGFPVSFRQSAATGFLLSGGCVLQFTDDELRTMLSGGVLMDSWALERLQEKGLGHLAGFSLRGYKQKDTHELYSSDPLNGEAAGRHRDCRPSFWHQPTAILDPIGDGARVLANIHDFADKEYGCCAGAYENELGGRVAIMGYYPWSSLKSFSKSTQLKNVVRWLSKDRIPAYVSSYQTGLIWARRDAKGRPAFMVGNPIIEAVDAITINILGCGDSIKMTRMDGSEKVLQAKSHDGPYSVFEVGPLAPWDFCVLSAE